MNIDENLKGLGGGRHMTTNFYKFCHTLEDVKIVEIFVNFLDFSEIFYFNLYAIFILIFYF
jgi:hypothetical protein